VTTISRVMSGHCSIRAHLERFKIVWDPICVCVMNYETVDHIIWECSIFEVERRQLLLGLAAVNIKQGTPIRDPCALQKWTALRLCCRFLWECGPTFFFYLEFQRKLEPSYIIKKKLLIFENFLKLRKGFFSNKSIFYTNEETRFLTKNPPVYRPSNSSRSHLTMFFFHL
jgi:hypothetical protein